jgi:molybdopterin-guanine dinucleotide biosynthesis protein A
MGEDKALVRLAGRPLIEWALETFGQAGLEARIAGARSRLAAFAPVVEDDGPGCGPLGGICAALASMDARRAVFVPVDLPLLPASLIDMLLNHAEITGRLVTIASVNGFAQTFPAVLKREALAALREELEAGRRGCFSAFQAAAARVGEKITTIGVEQAVQARQVDHFGGLSAARWFLNVNAQEDLCQAGAYRRAGIG